MEKSTAPKRDSSPEAFEALRPYHEFCGITRVGNITGLDRLGIPVWIATRPNSKTICLNSGKGTTHDQARMSAVCEAIEFAVAENHKTPFVKCSWRLLENVCNPVPVEDLPLCRNSLFNEESHRNWTICKNIGTAEDFAMPTEIIGMNYGDRGLLEFQVGSNGLASGATIEEAIRSGLMEIIERDAWTLFSLTENAGIRTKRVELSSIPDGLNQDLIQKIEHNGVRVFIHNLTTDIGVPVFRCVLVDTETDAGVFAGFGCSTHKHEALTRAITEAVQSRCCYIAGARDDMFRRSFILLKATDSRRTIEELEAAKKESFGDIEYMVFDSPEGEMKHVIGALENVGVDNVLCYDMTHEQIPLAVVRVMAPGLEGHAFEFYKPGWRAESWMQRKK